MCLNNFKHNLSTALMPQTFEGFNDFCTKAHDIEIHLSKHRKSVKKAGESRPVAFCSDSPTRKSPYSVGSIITEKPYVTNPGVVKKTPLAAASIIVQVLYQKVPSEDKPPSLQERQAWEYSFKPQNTRELFKELLEHNTLTLPEIKCPNEVNWTIIQNIVHTTGWSATWSKIASSWKKKSKIWSIVGAYFYQKPRLKALLHQLSITKDIEL